MTLYIPYEHPVPKRAMYPVCMPTYFAMTISPTVAQQALSTCAGLEQLQQLPYVRAILAESLRLYPQPPILIRRALADDVLPTPLGGDPKGYPIGKGADIFISVWNLHRWDGSLCCGLQPVFLHCCGLKC